MVSEKRFYSAIGIGFIDVLEELMTGAYLRADRRVDWIYDWQGFAQPIGLEQYRKGPPGVEPRAPRWNGYRVEVLRTRPR